jgi:hypothetical protein
LINFKLRLVLRNIKEILVFFWIVFLFSSLCFSFQTGEEAAEERSFDSLQKSLLIPGWGQFAEKKYIDGAVLLSAEIFCLYKVFENNHRSNKNYDLYKAAGNVEDTVKYRNLTEKFDRRRNAFILGALGIWAVNLIDIYVIVKNKKNKDKNFNIQLESGENKTPGFTLSLNFTF